MAAARRLHSILFCMMVRSLEMKFSCLHVGSSFTLSIHFRYPLSVVSTALFFRWQNDVIYLLATVHFPSLKHVRTKSIFVPLFWQPKKSFLVVRSFAQSHFWTRHVLLFLTRCTRQYCLLCAHAHCGIIFTLSLSVAAAELSCSCVAAQRCIRL